MTNDAFETRSETPPAPFTADPDHLHGLVREFGPDMLYAMRDVMRQARPFLDRRADLGALALGPLATDSLRAAAHEAADWLDALPPAHAAAQGPARAMTAPGGDDPRLSRVITVFTALFGGFVPTGRDMGPPVAVHVPLVDYRVEDRVEKALSLAVDVTHATARKASFAVKLRGVGLSGWSRHKVTQSLKGAPRDYSFQVVVPVLLTLTEYEGPMRGLLAYTAWPAGLSEPRPQRLPQDRATWVEVAPPPGVQPLETAFLNSDGKEETTSVRLEKGQGLALSVPLKRGDWLEASVDCETEALLDIDLHFTKTKDRADRLLKRQYPGQMARWEIRAA